MIPTPALPRPVRTAAAAASVVGVVLLAGCAAESAPAAETTPTTTATPEATASAPAEEASDSTYADGTYTAINALKGKVLYYADLAARDPAAAARFLEKDLAAALAATATDLRATIDQMLD